MKTVYKFLGSGALAITFALAAPTVNFAQETEKDTWYNQFVACRKETDKAKLAACYALAKQYVDKYGNDTDEYTTYVKKQLATYTARVEKEALINRFDTSTKRATFNADEAFSSGRVIYTQQPDLIDVPIVLAAVGYELAVAKTPNDKYNNDAINYAKTVIQQFESGKTSQNYGANAFNFKDPAFPDAKSNTLGWMNYTIGYIMYNRQGMKKEALPYLYKATQLNSGTKTLPQIYQTIGNYYAEELLKMDKDRLAKIEAAGKVDTDETKALLALEKGYAERAAEAFARAYKAVNADAANKPYKDSLLTNAKEVYSIRFDKDMAGFDAYVNGLSAKSFTDPTTAVVPVAEAAPATTTTSSTTTPAAATTVNTTATPAPTAKPASTTTTPVKTTAAPASSTTKTTPTTTTKTATPVKKKGTR